MPIKGVTAPHIYCMDSSHASGTCSGWRYLLCTKITRVNEHFIPWSVNLLIVAGFVLIRNRVAQFQQTGQLSPSLMPTTTYFTREYTSISRSSTLSLPSSSQSDLSMSAPVWESSTTESQNESLPPRIRLKKKRDPFSEFRIIREPAPIHDSTELKPIPSPPWANDSYTLKSSHHLHDDTRGKRTPAPQQNCTYARKSSAECSSHTLPDQDEDDIAVVKQPQHSHSGTEANTFQPPARPSRKQKRYACDVCGQIFTRSGDVRRHKESRHDNSQGCRCPFCDRVLTR